MFAAGGEILLERNSTFNGALTIQNLSLPSGSLLTIAAYGEGDAPVISGLHVLTDWQDLGGGRWSTVCSLCKSPPAVFARDGVPLPLARWPNLDEGDGGYRYYSAAQGRTSITDDKLPPDSDWTGAEAVLRSAAWILDRVPVTSQTGATLNFGANTTYDLPKGYGYFLQNHPNALDRDGEWTYDAATHTLTVLLTDSVPADHQFAVSITDTLLKVTRSQGIQISGLRLQGAQVANLELNQASRVTLRDLESRNAGDTGIRCLNCQDLLLEDSSIDGALNHGLDVYNCTNCLVQRNRITNTATFAGMGRSGNGQYNGVRFGGTNAVFARNEVRRTGYLGIDVRGAAIIQENTVSEFNLVKTDGGGIYTWGNRDVHVIGNIVHHGAGSKSVVPWNNPATHGLYIDDQTENVRLIGNTVSSVGSYGIYLHNTRNVTVERNTVEGAGDAQIGYSDDSLGSYEVTETKLRENLFVNTRPGALMARASTNGQPGFFASIGEMTGSRYCAPFGEAVFGTSLPAQSRVFLGAWQQLVGTDNDAQVCPQRFPDPLVDAVTGADRVQNGRFDKDLSGWFGWPGDSLQARWTNGRMELRHTAAAPIIHYDTGVGLIDAGQFYRARFEAFSDQPNRLLRVYLRKWEADYRNLSPVFDLPLSDQPRSYEIVLPATITEVKSLLIFELPNASQVVWLDNVQLEPVSAQSLERGDYYRLEWNATPEPRILTLDYECSDAFGNLWPAGAPIQIEPFGSVLLFRATPR